MLLQQPSIQDKDDMLLDDYSPYANAPYLNECQKAFLQSIAENFRPEESETDKSILYETTGFQYGSCEHPFWDKYSDFEHLGQSALVREDQNEELFETGKNSKKKV